MHVALAGPVRRLALALPLCTAERRRRALRPLPAYSRGTRRPCSTVPRAPMCVRLCLALGPQTAHPRTHAPRANHVGARTECRAGARAHARKRACISSPDGPTHSFHKAYHNSIIRRAFFSRSVRCHHALLWPRARPHALNGSADALRKHALPLIPWQYPRVPLAVPSSTPGSTLEYPAEYSRVPRAARL